MGPFTRARALAAGFSPAAIRRRLDDGTWVVLRRGVYVEASELAVVADDPQRSHALRVAALRLTLERDAVAAEASAARILGLESLAPPPTEMVVVTSGRSARGERRDGYVVRRAQLPVGHRTIRHGVPITTAVRTVVDLARTRPLADGVVIADSALREGVASLPALHAVLSDCSRWPGIDRAYMAIELADPKSESVLESVSRVAMYEQGLPAPRTQVMIGDGDGPFARVDFLWPDVCVVGEADGLGKYEPDGRRTTRDIVRAEKCREERLADAGFEVVRWGWQDAQNPPRLAHRLRAAFARATRRATTSPVLLRDD